MGRDTNSNASSGGSSSILTSILPCIRPRRSKQSIPEPSTEIKEEEEPKRRLQDLAPKESIRVTSFQSTGTPLELPTTPLAEDDGDGLEATMMREFARVSVQPIGTPWLSEFAQSESKPQEAASPQTSPRYPPAQLADHRQSKSSDKLAPNNNTSNVTEESIPEPSSKETKSPVVEDAQPKDPEPRPATPTNIPDEPAREEPQPGNNEQSAIQQDKDQGEGQEKDEIPSLEKASGSEETSEPTAPVDGGAEKQASDPTGDESTTKDPGVVTEKLEAPETQPKTKDSSDNAGEAKDTTAT
ncbi:hypothetical protein FQN54_005352 [Arachnomyces sp. PD_36]|nr:hypothetical protein FQN54_005352 [Arachnomyces sp. PD_36]